MAYDVRTRLDLLGSRMKELNQLSIVYQRSTMQTTIQNVACAKSLVSVTGDEITLESEYRGYIFDASELNGFTPPVPQAGDTISDGVLTCEVVKIDDQTHNFTTSTRKRVRVHTRVVRNPRIAS